MAEITTGENRQKNTAGVARLKKHSTRVDLTPMVDLGFLLITFFIFTTSMSQPNAMKMVMPDDRGKPTPTRESGAITLLLGNNSIHYYEGRFELSMANLHNTNLVQLRDIIVDKKRRTPPRDFVVVIKPGVNANFKNMVDVLDEMTINDVRKYALVDISAAEQEYLP